VNCFNEPLGNKSDEQAAKRHVMSELSRDAAMSGVVFAYDGDRLLFSMGKEISAVAELQPKPGFSRTGTR
jgi:hypothetical protein